MRVSLPTVLILLIGVFLSGSNATAQIHDAPPQTFICASTGARADAATDAQLAKMAKQWSTGTPLTDKKCYHGATYLDGAMYVFGGLGGTLRFDVKSWKFDIATSTWSAIRPLPVQRGLPVVEAVDGKIYIIGGYSAVNPFTVQRPVLEYDPATDTYTDKADMMMAVFGAGSFVLNGRIYVLGGGTTAFATSTDAVQIYDPAQDKWTFSPSMTPFASWATGVTVIGNTAFYVGGVRYTNGQGLFGSWSYKGDVAGDEITWTQIANYPDGSIMRHSAGTDGSKAYFSGGYRQESMNNGPPSGMTYSYDPVGGLWEMRDIKPTGVYFGSQMIFDGTDKLYVMGGQDAPSAVTGAVEIFDVTAEGGPLALFNKTEFDLSLKTGSSATQNVPLKNNGSVSLTWSAAVTSASDWLTLSTASGVVESGGSTDIPMSINSSDVGDHSGTVTVTTNDPDNASVDVTVTVHVQDEDIDTDMNVVLEEGTGTWCGFCPYGADSVKALVEEFHGRVFGIAYHGGSTTEPMKTPHTDFWTAVVGLTGWPNASINRIVFEGESKAAISRSAWGNRIREVLQTRRSPISIAVVDKSYDPADKEMSLTIEVFFHRRFSEPLRLNIAQLQDRMNYTQSFYPSTGGSTKLFPYYHDHVLRQIIPGDEGEIISSGMPVASQTTVSKTFTFTSVDSTIATSRFVIFAHISDGVNFGEIIQAEELLLSSFVTDVEALPESAAFTLHPNYPNPFNPATTISFDVPDRSNVSVMVRDALGRVVVQLSDGVLDAGRHTMTWNAGGMPSGTYFLTMRAGEFTRTRTMTLMK